MSCSTGSSGFLLQSVSTLFLRLLQHLENIGPGDTQKAGQYCGGHSVVRRFLDILDPERTFPGLPEDGFDYVQQLGGVDGPAQLFLRPLHARQPGDGGLGVAKDLGDVALPNSPDDARWRTASSRSSACILAEM